jgi:hypothetical protein
LADLTQAIDEAQRLAWRISSDGEHPEAMDLYVRLELARTEVESLRRSGWASVPRDCRPEWIELLQDNRGLPRSWS